MYGRTSLLAYRSGNYGTLRLIGLTTSAFAVTGGVVHMSTTKTEGHHSYSVLIPKSSLVIPTLEASIRAWRLISTATFMVFDYELSMLEGTRSKMLSVFDTNATSLEQNNAGARRYWEEEVANRQKVLDDAQTIYTLDVEEDETGPLSPETRRKMKLKQKQDVYVAAERLGEAQKSLAKIGDRMSEVHTKAANRLLTLCRKNGGTYIKIGQHLANLDYLIPQEYIEVLSSLFDDAPKTEFNDVREVIKEELGEYPEDIFQSFQQEPIASASLAQVHTAIEKSTGRKLAVKIQHRGLRETSAGDLFALTAVVRAVERILPDFTWGWIADEIAPQLPKELDFCNEGRNSENAAKHLEEHGIECVIPKVLWEHTTPRVLCMEFEEGFKATDTDSLSKAGLRRRDVAKLISSVFSAQAFLSGFVHCDPHPANVLIRNNNGKPQMVLVDHGLYKQIDDDFRIRYASLWRSLMMADIRGIKQSCQSLGVDEMYTLLAGMLTSRPFDEIIERAKTGSLSTKEKPDSVGDKAMIQGYAQRYMREIFEILGTLPRQMLLLLKMNDCLRHIDFALGSPTNTLAVAGQYAARAIHEHQIAASTDSVRNKVKSWMDYMKVLLRIKIYEIGVWMSDRTNSLKT